ncbi:MAG TPA: enoyl-CoA hydratase/isomerase family protein, partial [Gemmataceae bacterium]|nr:enoyl-CoA hydratase/isomerase family protein [Gemmataceae bacterium]
FPGEPVNALDLARLRELDNALTAIEHNPFIRTLVVRSALPAGFCAGVHPEALASLTTGAERGSFAWFGQRVFDRLARLPFTTLAFIDGPCLGAGLELALACDHRLCVARPTTHLGFPDAPRGIPPCFGGTARLRRLLGRPAEQFLGSGRTLSGREAQRLGLVDEAFCERRAKIELRTFLDQLERREAVASPERERGELDFAAERRAFTQALDTEASQATIRRRLDALKPLSISPVPVNPIPPFPAVVGLVGDDEFASQLVAQAVLRGGQAVLAGADVSRGIDLALARGFVTPLEADQARGRVKVAADLRGFERAGLVFVAEGEAMDRLADVLRPRCVVVVMGCSRDASCPDPRDRNAAERGRGGNGSADVAHPRRVIGLRAEPTVELVRFPDTDSDTVATLAAWLKPLGFTPTITAATALPMTAAA